MTFPLIFGLMKEKTLIQKEAIMEAKTRFSRILRIVLGLILIWVGLAQFAFSTITNDDYSEEDYEVSQAEYAELANSYLQDEGIKTPLLLQNDERWAYEAYGSDGDQTIAENGCAPTSLAMILSYQEKRDVSPTEITDWAQDQYYEPGSGTDWSIFPAFAEKYQLTLHDLGADFTKAQTYLEQDIPVVVSALPGEFTDSGHIMVMTRYPAEEELALTILDPSDNDDKSHAYTAWYFPNEIIGEFQHYWAFTKETSL